ncbi:MAG: flagellar protein FliT [Betaproteobacteria bacterium]|nr:flagellar protein FliT [Betaproteobacteria bacterium]
MTSKEVIGTYENILAVTAQMLDAARAADWDLLVNREQECRKLVESLMNTRNENDIVLEPQVLGRKVEIIRKVLADDAEIRNLTEPWMQRLQHLLTSVGHERRLHAAYNAGATD